MSEDFETWKNTGKGMISINRKNPEGREESIIVRPGHTVELTEKDRKYRNVERANNPGNDVFSRGFLQPVELLDEKSIAEVAANPNILNEDDIEALFDLDWRKFDSEVAKISNTATVERLLSVAQDSDSTTARQVDVIENRLVELQPHFRGDKGGDPVTAPKTSGEQGFDPDA